MRFAGFGMVVTDGYPQVKRKNGDNLRN